MEEASANEVLTGIWRVNGFDGVTRGLALTKTVFDAAVTSEAPVIPSIALLVPEAKESACCIDTSALMVRAPAGKDAWAPLTLLEELAFSSWALVVFAAKLAVTTPPLSDLVGSAVPGKLVLVALLLELEEPDFPQLKQPKTGKKPVSRMSPFHEPSRFIVSLF